MQEIITLSRANAEVYHTDKPWACISIVTEEEDRPKIHADNKLIGLLQLTFGDYDTEKYLQECKDEGRVDKDVRLFDESDAASILEFVERLQFEIDILMIHCNMGYSRSPAVAGALSKIYFNEDERFFKSYQPNMHVYRTILSLWEKRLKAR